MTDRNAQLVAHRASLISSSPEDDAAYVALADLSTTLAAHPDSRIIGGHMVSLLTTVFPAADVIIRRTGDADGGIPVALATTGEVHHALINAGYTAVVGNHYEKRDGSKAVIDLLIPSLDGRFRREERGGRGFDAMPGLQLALIRPAIDIQVIATLRDGTELEFDTRTPTVEVAIILKAVAYGDRGAQTPKDAVDISNLLEALDEHGADTVCGWRMNEDTLIGARQDAARNLHKLARVASTGRLNRTGIRGERLTYLIRKWVSRVS